MKKELETSLIQDFQQMSLEHILINVHALLEKVMEMNLRLQIDICKGSKGGGLRD
jgi:hypothetical protein